MKRNAKKLLVAALSLALSVSGIGFSQNASEAQAATKKVKLNKKKVTLTVGDTYKLKLKNVKKSQKVKWSTSKKKVATVSKKGKVTAKKKGTAKITAKLGKKKYTCTVKVKAKAKNKNTATATPTSTPKNQNSAGQATPTPAPTATKAPADSNKSNESDKPEDGTYSVSGKLTGVKGKVEIIAFQSSDYDFYKEAPLKATSQSGTYQYTTTLEPGQYFVTVNGVSVGKVTVGKSAVTQDFKFYDTFKVSGKITLDGVAAGKKNIVVGTEVYEQNGTSQYDFSATTDEKGNYEVYVPASEQAVACSYQYVDEAGTVEWIPDQSTVYIEKDTPNQDINFTSKAVYKVSGKITGIKDFRHMNEIEFYSESRNSSYWTVIEEDGNAYSYSLSLRPGEYQVRMNYIEIGEIEVKDKDITQNFACYATNKVSGTITIDGKKAVEEEFSVSTEDESGDFYQSFTITTDSKGAYELYVPSEMVINCYFSYYGSGDESVEWTSDDSYFTVTEDFAANNIAFTSIALTQVSGKITGVKGEITVMAFCDEGGNVENGEVTETEGTYEYSVYLAQGTYQIKINDIEIGTVTVGRTSVKKDLKFYNTCKLSGTITMDGTPAAAKDFDASLSGSSFSNTISFTTGNDGSYELYIPVVGDEVYCSFEYVMSASYVRWSSDVGEIEINGVNKKQNIAFTSEKLYLVAGTLTGVKNSSFDLSFFNADSGESFGVATEKVDDETYTFSTFIAPGDYSVLIDNYKVGSLKVENSNVTNLTYAFYDAYRISGVIKMDGEAASKVWITIGVTNEDEGYDNSYSVSTQKDGSFELYLRKDITGECRISLENYDETTEWTSDVTEFTLTGEDMQKDVNFTGKKKYLLSGNVTDFTINYGDLKFTSEDGDFSDSVYLNGAEGDGNASYLKYLVSGTYTVTLDGIEIGTVTVDGEDVEKDFKCYDTYKVYGKITVDGEPASEREFSVMAASGDDSIEKYDYFTTDEDGNYEIMLPVMEGTFSFYAYSYDDDTYLEADGYNFEMDGSTQEQDVNFTTVPQ